MDDLLARGNSKRKDEIAAWTDYSFSFRDRDLDILWPDNVIAEDNAAIEIWDDVEFPFDLRKLLASDIGKINLQHNNFLWLMQ